MVAQTNLSCFSRRQLASWFETQPAATSLFSHTGFKSMRWDENAFLRWVVACWVRAVCLQRRSFRTGTECIQCGIPIQRATSRRFRGRCGPCSSKHQCKMENHRLRARPGCPACDDTRYLDLNWASVTRQCDHWSKKYVGYLKLERKLRVGQLHACTRCFRRWYLDGSGRHMVLIPTDRHTAIDAWHATPQPAPERLTEQLQTIGATPPDRYGNGRGVVAVPCEVTTKSGQVFSKAMVQFQQGPPIDSRMEHWRFVDEIESVRASPFCLPRAVRLATSQAHELTMGSAPILVQDSSARAYFLNWTTNFFDYEGVRGPEISLSNLAVDMFPPVLGEFRNNITYFVADYTASADDFYILAPKDCP